MNKLDYDYAPCDLILLTYDYAPNGFVSHAELSEARRIAPVPDEKEVYAFLMDEGLLKELPDGFQITRRGRILVHEGGFKGRSRRKRISRILVLIGAISGVVAAVASILSLIL